MIKNFRKERDVLLSISKILFIVALLCLLSGCSGDTEVYSETIEPTHYAQEIDIQELDTSEKINIDQKDTGDSEAYEPNSDADGAEELEVVEPNLSVTPEDNLNSSYQPLMPNEIGEIMVIMYHGLKVENLKEQYDRSVDGFKDDLQNLYDAGFRLIKLSDLINNNITVPAGYTPVVLTFDDGARTAFSLVDNDGVLEPTEDSAVDIINKFYERNNAFGKAATFFVNEKPYPFYGAGTLAERFKYLLDNGFEIGNHGSAHASLKKADKEMIEDEIGRVDKMIRENTENFTPLAIAYPYGDRPAEPVRQYVLNGTYDEHEYEYKYAFHVGYNGLSSIPYHINFDPLNVPRVRGTDNANTDLGWHLRMYAEYPERRFVSDGNPDTVTVPQQYADNVNVDKLNEKELLIY